MRTATSLAIVVLAGCGDPVVAELYPVMGRPGAMSLDGQLFEYEEGDDETKDDDATEPLSAIGDDGPEGVTYDVSIAGRCERRGETKSDGIFTQALPAACDAPAGRRRTTLRVDGRVIGTGTATLLPMDRPALVVTSDVDMTYLETRFKSAPEIAALLSTPAARHAPLAGMPEIYRRLRQRADALRFISGSPTFFRRHLLARLKIDRILADEVTLKDMGAIVGANWKAPQAIEDALREQVGYKLSALLEGRLRLPPVTREVLLGDDTEMDAYAYRLYRDALSGALSPERLASSLRQLGVGDVRVGAIGDLLPRVLAWRKPPSAVILIGIRETDRPNTHHPARRVADPGMVFHRDSASLGAALAAVHVL